MLYMLIAYNKHVFNGKEYYFDSMTYLQTNYSVTITENCEKIELLVVKLCSKTKCITFF